ncbi:LysR family transcriptional regulator [Aquincola sp. S2]|uniref:LysR family transcriptional regulator n=1 Tax=Pseudaquabacterium terrae TaxID=2732868 RepID=A0ABX2EEL0_9BURK|nr:LysR family transcriptional regulator [Aquabacterium terrae]NRF67047.1 LysR family transcriptional regulator [Aquabacterium terrae]
MARGAAFDKIELSLVRVFHTVITERSVSRAALRLATSQPAVSAQLKRLRALTGDPLLVRSGTGMAPTTVALSLLPAAAQILQGAQALFGGHSPAQGFAPEHAEQTFRIAASDYLDPLFLPELVSRVKTQAPNVHLDLLPLTRDFDYRGHLARGEVDVVIGNWLQPPAELHLGRLISDEIVCLVAQDHPAVRSPRSWTLERYLASEHIAPTPLHAGGRGVVEEHLQAAGLERNIAVRTPHFGLAPAMVARTHLVLTTGRQFCARYVGILPVRIVRCPVDFPPLTYYQLWHDLTHASAAIRWLREQVRDVARGLSEGGRA